MSTVIQSSRMAGLLLSVPLWLTMGMRPSDGFVVPSIQPQRTSQRILQSDHTRPLRWTTESSLASLHSIDNNDNATEDDNNNDSATSSSRTQLNRRDAVLTAAAASSTLFGRSTRAAHATATINTNTNLSYQPATRPTAYRVDSTIPPTLLPVPTARQQTRVLRELGQRSGTDKEAVFVDTINLNNMLNKAVYGTLDAVRKVTAVDGGSDGSNSEVAACRASFVCLGLPCRSSSSGSGSGSTTSSSNRRGATPVDVELALDLTAAMAPPLRKSSKNAVAQIVGVAAFPQETQAALDGYGAGTVSLEALQTGLTEAGVSAETLSLYQPLLERYGSGKTSNSNSNTVRLVAMALNRVDLEAVSSKGLQNVNPDARQAYVKDPQGFIALTGDPRFKLYTDRSLLRNNNSNNNNNNAAAGNDQNIFAQRILEHEAAATAIAQAAVAAKDCLVVILADTADVRYLQGLNGRIPRVYNALVSSESSSSSTPPCTPNDVTTILLNPTAADTLSASVRLRLEIGTGPETLAYQTKIADYLWFSASPAVKILPRVMDY